MRCIRFVVITYASGGSRRRLLSPDSYDSIAECADGSRAAIDSRPLGLHSTCWIPGKSAGMLPSTLTGQPNRPEM